MKLNKSAIAIAMLAASTTACAGHAGGYKGQGYQAQNKHSYTDYATVTHVEPITETVEVNRPYEECHTREVVRQARGDDYYSYTPTILGGILGAAIGNEIGNKNSRDVLTVAGAVLGGSMGRDYTNKHQGRSGGSYTVPQRHCETFNDVSYREDIVGYRVSYTYDGRSYTTRMSHDPGNQIRVKVAVRPLD